MIIACTLYKYGDKYMVYHKFMGDDVSPVCDLLLKLKSVYAQNQLDKIDGLYTMSFDHIGKSTSLFRMPTFRGSTSQREGLHAIIIALMGVTLHTFKQFVDSQQNNSACWVISFVKLQKVAGHSRTYSDNGKLWGEGGLDIVR